MSKIQLFGLLSQNQASRVFPLLSFIPRSQMPRIIINPDFDDLIQEVLDLSGEQERVVTVLVEVAQLERFSDLVSLLKGVHNARHLHARVRLIVYVHFEVTQEILLVLRGAGVLQVFGVRSSDLDLLREFISAEKYFGDSNLGEQRASESMSELQVVAALSMDSSLTVDLVVQTPQELGLPYLRLDAVFHDYFEGVLLVRVTPGRVMKGQDVVLGLKWQQDGKSDVHLGQLRGVVAEIEACDLGGHDLGGHDLGGQTLLEIQLAEDVLPDLQRMYLEVGRRQGVSSQFIRLARGL